MSQLNDQVMAEFRANGGVVRDAGRERRPRFIPSAVISGYTQLLGSYNKITEVRGDKVAGGFHRSCSFRSRG